MLTQEDRELIPFSNAVSRVYTEITGDYLSPFGDPAMTVLHDVAKVISSVVTIYGARTGHESLKPLPTLELRHGTFQRGATVVRTSNGTEYRRLYIRRCDVRAAAIVLKKSGVRFASIEESLAASEASIGPAVGGETEAAVV